MVDVSIRSETLELLDAPVGDRGIAMLSTTHATCSATAASFMIMCQRVGFSDSVRPVL